MGDLNWDDFDQEDNTGITDQAEAAEVPKACAIDTPDCEACQ